MNALRSLFALIVLFTACGQTSGPVEIPAEDLPFDVSRSESTIETRSPVRSFAVYFVRDDRMVEVRRELEADARSANLILRALLEGPSEDERARSVSTEIPREVRLLDVSIADGTARVDLSGEFQEPAPPADIALRVGQVVWTLTSLPDVGSVAFSIDGDPVAVTTDDGAAVERRVSREDYSELSPR